MNAASYAIFYAISLAAFSVVVFHCFLSGRVEGEGVAQSHPTNWVPKQDQKSLSLVSTLVLVFATPNCLSKGTATLYMLNIKI